MNKRVLVTGASGFVGRHTIPHLLEHGYEVHAVVQAPAQPLERSLAGAAVHVADLLRPAEQDALLRAVQPTHLLHLAWDVTPDKYWRSLANVQWVQASLDLLQAFAGQGGRRWVGAGTCAEYSWSGAEPLQEDRTPLKPASLYGASKVALSTLQNAMARELGVNYAWGRIFFLYGPHESPGRLIPAVIRALLAGEDALVRHEHLVRDWLHVTDVAAAFVQLLDHESQEAVNIAGGQAITLGEVARRIADSIGRPDLLRFGNTAALDQPPTIVADISRLKSLGFTPRFSLEEGLRNTIDWWRQS